jgi:hypothetical protein
MNKDLADGKILLVAPQIFISLIAFLICCGRLL